MNETYLEIDGQGRLVEQWPEGSKHRFLLPRKQRFTNLDEFVDFLYKQERTVPWYENNKDQDGLVLDLR